MRGIWIKGVATAALLGVFASPAMAQSADVGNTAATEGRLAVGQSVSGALETAGDADWFQITLRGGQGYRFTLDSAGDPPIDPVLRLLNASGEEVGANDDGPASLNSQLDIEAPADGVYYLEATAFGGQSTGGYTLAAQERAIPTDGVPASTATTARLTPGAPVQAAVDFDGDVDWYRTSLRAGRLYHITLTAADRSGLDPYLRVLNADGEELAANDDSGGTLNSALDFTPEAAGTFYVEARNLGEIGAGAYTLAIEDRPMPRDTIRGDARTRGRLAVGGTVEDALDFPRDTDWFRVSLVGGQTYRFTLNSRGEGDSALSDPFLRLLNSAGEEIAHDDDGGEGLNSYLEFSAPASGTYFVEARGFSSEARGAYTLRMLAGDVPSNATTDITLDSGGDYRDGRIEPAGDKDWYAFTLGAGDTVRLQVLNGGQSGLGDPMLSVFNEAGEELATDDDSGGDLNAYVEFTAPAAGRYFLEARAFSSDATGAYSVQLTPGEIGANADTAEPIGANNARQSQIMPEGDVDWLSFDVVEGRAYRVFMDTTGEDGWLDDPYLTVLNSEGNPIASDDDGGFGLNARVAFIAPVSGTFYAAASGFNNQGTGRYMLRVSDFEVPGNGGTDESLDPAEDSRQSRIDMSGDKDWYAVELTAGATYRIAVNGVGSNRLADPMVALISGEDQNTELASDDDSGPGQNALLTYAATTGQIAFIQVTGFGAGVGDYELIVNRVDTH